MSIEQTLGSPEHEILLDRIAKKFAEMSDAKELVIRGFIRKTVEKLLVASTIKEAGGADPETRAKIVLDVIKSTAQNIKLDEKLALDEAFKIYAEWKKEFNR